MKVCAKDTIAQAETVGIQAGELNRLLGIFHVLHSGWQFKYQSNFLSCCSFLIVIKRSLQARLAARTAQDSPLTTSSISTVSRNFQLETAFPAMMVVPSPELGPKRVWKTVCEGFRNCERELN